MRLLARLVREQAVELNVEGNPFSGPVAARPGSREDYPGFLPLVLETNPEQCTLVPDNPGQLTSDRGFDLRREGARLAPLVEELRAAGCRVSLFLDADAEQVPAAAECGAQCVELFTGPYAACRTPGERRAAWEKLQTAASRARELGLRVHAGHDLNLENLPQVARLPGLQEVSIGHALTVDALRMGFAQAIGRYRSCLLETG